MFAIPSAKLQGFCHNSKFFGTFFAENQEMIDKLNVLQLDYENLAEEKLQKRRKRNGYK